MLSQRNLLGMVVALAASGAVLAQADGSLRWRAGTAPLGLQAATNGFRVQCGTGSLACETASVPLYASRVAPRSLSLQLGASDRSAVLKMAAPQGLSVQLVGKAGLFSDVGVYGRFGTTVGRSNPLAARGASEGLSYGVGLSWDLSRSASAILGWDSYDVRGAGGDVRDVRATSLGLQWRY